MLKNIRAGIRPEPPLVSQAAPAPPAPDRTPTPTALRGTTRPRAKPFQKAKFWSMGQSITSQQYSFEEFVSSKEDEQPPAPAETPATGEDESIDIDLSALAFSWTRLATPRNIAAAVCLSLFAIGGIYLLTPQNKYLSRDTTSQKSGASNNTWPPNLSTLSFDKKVPR